MQAIAEPYLWLKWLHVIAIISWMAGLLYLYRIFVNIVDHGGRSQDTYDVLCGMARRLFKYITVPACIVALITGFGMIGMNHALAQSGWFMVKFACVLGMLHFTAKGGVLTKRFAARSPKLPTSRTLRILNEMPTLLLLVIVFMVIFKPF